jgi:acyl dehydratase
VIPNAIWRIPRDIGRRYAEVSGDRNPIHLSSLTARMFGFPSAIAHGMWTKARCLAMFEGKIPERLTIDARFTAPVLLPVRAAFSVRRASAGWSYAVTNLAKPKVYLTGEVSVDV